MRGVYVSMDSMNGSMDLWIYGAGLYGLKHLGGLVGRATN